MDSRRLRCWSGLSVFLLSGCADLPPGSDPPTLRVPGLTDSPLLRRALLRRACSGQRSEQAGGDYGERTFSCDGTP